MNTLLRGAAGARDAIDEPWDVHGGPVDGGVPTRGRGEAPDELDEPDGLWAIWVWHAAITTSLLLEAALVLAVAGWYYSGTVPAPGRWPSSRCCWPGRLPATTLRRPSKPSQ